MILTHNSIHASRELSNERAVQWNGRTFSTAHHPFSEGLLIILCYEGPGWLNVNGIGTAPRGDWVQINHMLQGELPSPDGIGVNHDVAR